MAERRSFKFLDQKASQTLSANILLEVNKRIQQRTTDVIEANDNFHVPTSAAIISLIAKSRFARMQPVIGDINELLPIESRESTVIYLQKDDINDRSWCMYIWSPPNEDTGEEGFWIALGDTEPSIYGYWSKSEEDIEELKSRIGLDNIDYYVRKEEMIPFTQEELVSLINNGINDALRDED